MRIQSLQHVPFEDIGSMAQDFDARSYPVFTTHWYRGDPVPALDSFDALIVMGGPMGIYDEAIHPWLAEEKKLIREAIQAGKVVLGICLGAQLIADVLGGPVTRNPHKEIGWFPLSLVPGAEQNPVALVLERYPEVFHWHGDTFAIPPGAQWLARSQACAHQAFCYGDKVWGFQFHLETTLASASALVENCADDLDGSTYSQDAASLLGNTERFERINQAMSEVINIIFAGR
ncbi:type 1 glutamine amidotransferase [Cellvibrio japonicus]|uniref:Conserved proteinconserved protein n=1 Tax=Cellvibrio japonicus (strain Ueda107) TaxID=498211 RepID=B3PLE3_CELJU|nr:type 1 glutamine amidotransferase [Cellvibrio japonicus]ACE83560.1 conserved proteinconserved protein [Cellvibrio japonicus Ueda107]QEI11594.1 type 1 glutamine amidotransferase [Cellvibrio japonicus]QEI15168.1 type 1 glutamine amidotransferase [Cellvibrio japonicus]QEI18748.1 type 1 glutamine amidotransferase [Cellvibrio japonicus]